MMLRICKFYDTGAAVVAQLVELSLPTPEIYGSNPDIGKIFIFQLYNTKEEIKEKKAENGPS